MMKFADLKPWGQRFTAGLVTLATVGSMMTPSVALADMYLDDTGETYSSYTSDTLSYADSTATMNGYDGGGMYFDTPTTINVTEGTTNNVNGSIEVEGDVNIQGGGELNVTNEGTGDSETYGIVVGSREPTADINIDGTTVNVSVTSDGGYISGIDTGSGSISIDNAAVNVSVTNDAGSTDDSGYANSAHGIRAGYDSINISNSVVEAEATANGVAEAIACYDGTVNIDNSEVAAFATSNESRAYGIVGTFSDGINITDSAVLASADSGADGVNSYGLYSWFGDINIDNSTVLASGDVAMISHTPIPDRPGQINIVNSELWGANIQDLADDELGMYGQVIGFGTDVITSLDSEDVASVALTIADDLVVTDEFLASHEAAKQLPTTSDSTSYALGTALAVTGLVATGAAISRRRTQE